MSTTQTRETSGNRGVNALLVISLALAAASIAFVLAGTLLQPLEWLALDSLFRFRGPIAESSEVVIVAIDDDSFTATGYQWPWPRDFFADTIDAIAEGEPYAIAIDVLFLEASANPTADTQLAEAIANAGNVVLAANLSSQTDGRANIQRLNLPIPELTESAAAIGLANFPRDTDGVVRRVISHADHHGEPIYSWALEATRLYIGATSFARTTDSDIQIGSLQIPLLGRQLFVDFRGSYQSVPYYSIYQVANGTVNPAVFQNKIVLIGATTETLHDSYPTPFGGEPPTPGVEINAHAIDTILSKRFYTIMPGILGLLLASAGALTASILVLRVRTLIGIPATLILASLYIVIVVFMFMQARVMLPIVGPLLAFGMVYTSGTTVRLIREQREKARVRSLFNRYVSPAAIDQMLTNPDVFGPGGERRDLTILFSDIRGFTTISEELSPDDVVEILNEYLTAMTEIIFKHEGAIDKFEGDAILAIWNAPLRVADHPTKAVQAAVEMLERLRELQFHWAATGKHILEIGIGINTGNVFVGNIGSAERMDYTVIGDAVNIAARLQDMTKSHNIPILFGETTKEAIKDTLAVRFVSTAHVKGRAQDVSVYTLSDL